MIPDPPHHKLFPPLRRRNVLRWALALLINAVALGISVSLPGKIEIWTISSISAVIATASVAGWRAGLFSAIVCVLSSAYLHLSGSPGMVYRVGELVHALLFAILATLICWSYAKLHSAERALRRSEEKFRSLVTNAPYGICSCTLDGVLLDVNAAMAAMLRYRTVDQLSNCRLVDLYCDPEQFTNLLDENGLLKRFDALRAEWKRSDNTVIVVRLSGRPIREENQNLFFELLAEDVTERHALEQQFRQAQKMEAVGRLAGGIAHDFNNLLMVISGYCELLIGQLGSESEMRRPAQEILNAADRAAALTRQLLAFSRKQVQAPRVLDLNDIVAEHLKMLPRLIGEDIKLTFIPGARAGHVRVDPGQAQQVIMNLAVNARDAMPNGGELSIETANVFLDEHYVRHRPNVRPGKYVLLSITDTGSGMDAETQSHLFEPFFTTKGQKGTGLGLSTVYGIVTQSGGHIWAKSAKGQGATFNIYFPHVEQLGRSAKQEAEHKPSRGRETILVVEDDTALRSLVRVFLEAHGYTVLEAENGDSALHVSRAYRGPVHLLLTDVVMPGMSSRELVKKLLSERSDMRVIYMSGYTDSPAGHHVKLDSQLNLLRKPFTSEALAVRVRKMLDTRPAARPLALVPEIPIERGRAPRFTIQLPMRFRMLGETEWSTATTENISRSGVLFRTDREVNPRAQIELQLTLPSQITGGSVLEVGCRGEVVRTIAAAATVPPGVAAKVVQYLSVLRPPVAEA